jgi:hypothetical protein
MKETTMEYTPEQLETLLPKINADGSVAENGILTVEEAMRLGGKGAAAPAPITDALNDDANITQTPPAPTEGEGGEGEGKKPELSIELDSEDSPITVGGITKPTSVWTKEMEDEYGVDASSLPEEARKKMVDGFINTKHKDAWQKSNTVKAQATAEQTRMAEQMKREADYKLQQAERARIESQAIRKRLEAEKQRIVQIAQTEINPGDIYDGEGRLDPQKQYNYNKVLMARERMADIDTDIRTVDEQLQKSEVDRTVLEIEAFQAEHPEYQMTEPLLAVIQKVEGQGLKTHPDIGRLLDVYDILDYARSRGVPLALAHDRLSQQGKLSVSGATAPGGATPPPAPLPSPSPADAQAKVIAAIRKKQSTQGPVLDGSGVGGRPSVLPKASLGDRMRDASQKAIGGGGNSALEKLGY